MSFKYCILLDDGLSNDLWTFSLTVFTSLFLVVNHKIMLTSKRFDINYILTILFLNYGSYIAYILITDPLHTFAK